MSHSWGDERILSHLQAGRELYKAVVNCDQTIKFPAPRFISCWISEVCNLDCTYCFFSNTNHDKSHTYIDTQKFLGWISNVKKEGAESLEFSGGGEPTLHPEFRTIFIGAYILGYKIGIITHACNDMPIDEMVDHFKYVRCGLDAATAETHDAIKRNNRKNYWFHKAIENIKEMVRLRDLKETKDFTVGIKIVLNSINFHELEKMIDMAYGLNVDYIQFKREHSSDHDLTKEQCEYAERFFENHKNIGVVKGTTKHARATTKCFMSPIHTVVTATGKILQCCFFEDRPIGTIFQPFNEVWGGEQHRKVIEMTTVQECDKLDCRWNYYNRKMKDIIEDPLEQSSFI